VVGYRIVKSGSTFIWPVIERVDSLSLELIPLDFIVAARDREGKDVKVQGQARIAVGQDEAAIYRAATLFLGKAPAEVADLVHPMLAQEIRAHATRTTVAEMQTSRTVADLIAQTWGARLAEVGLTCLALDVERFG